MKCGYCSTQPAIAIVIAIGSASGDAPGLRIEYPLCEMCMGRSAVEVIHDATEIAPFVLDVCAVDSTPL